jgi:hypothetical protein
MSEITVLVAAIPARPLLFQVVVRDARGESRHQVAVSAEDAARFERLGADHFRSVEAAMRFLLDREPKEAILSAFDIHVIRGYFPDFDDAFPSYLLPNGGKSA